MTDCPDPSVDGVCRHLTCGRCHQHTNNSTQGHYWSVCRVTKTDRAFHFCCPDDCELEETCESPGGTDTPESVPASS